MLSSKIKTTAGVGIAFTALLALSACSGTSGMTATAEPEGMSSETPSEMPSDEASSPAMADPAANLVGPGCADYASMVPDGAGSVQGMSQDPVAVAASNNPLLTQLVAAVSGQVNPDVDLVSTLNGGEFTVFAPVDDAFAQIDDATMQTLTTDADLLTSILTYHVVEGQVEPADIAGTHTTLQGEDLEVTGSGDELMVNDASVICGGVQTANATVYLIDTVLMPPM